MRAHVIEDGVVTNTIEVSSLSDLPNLVEATEGSIGWQYDGSNFTDPNAPTDEEAASLKASFNRKRRDNLLAESDWTQANDSPLSTEVKTSWATYRTALRDLPSHSNWPSLEDDDWPTKPS